MLHTADSRHISIWFWAAQPPSPFGGKPQSIDLLPTHESLFIHTLSSPCLPWFCAANTSFYFAAISNGANGYILKKMPPARLLEYITEAATGDTPMTAAIATQVLKMFAGMNSKQREDYNLSDREEQVLQLLVNGYSYKMIAAEMFIAIDTVRSHIKKNYEKLYVNSKSEAVAKAFKDRIV